MKRIDFSVQEIELAEIDKGVWSEYFHNYLLDPKRFLLDVDKQQAIIEALTDEIGLGIDGQRVLEGIAPKVKIWRRWVALQKAKPVADMIRAELAADQYKRVVVFAVHEDPLTELENHLRDLGTIKMFRGTPPLKKVHLWQKFAAKDGRRIALLHLVEGHALPNLALANDAIFVEASWQPDVNVEAVMRMANARQPKKTVNIRFIAAARSIDYKLMKLMKTKTKISPALDPEYFLGK